MQRVIESRKYIFLTAEGQVNWPETAQFSELLLEQKSWTQILGLKLHCAPPSWFFNAVRSAFEILSHERERATYDLPLESTCPVLV